MNPPTDPEIDRRPLGLSGRVSNDKDVPLTFEATIADARAEILKELVEGKTKTSAVTVALVDDRRILWTEAFGSIDRTRGLAPTTETLFCIASCSKVIAAIAVMILVDRGLIELDAPVVRYLPHFRMTDGEAYRDITVRMLLNHSSGLHGTHFRNILTIVPVPGYAAQFLDALAAERLKHPPGEMAAYCSDGFTLVEVVVAAVTGHAYTEFVAKEILEPLGMHHSRFALAPFESGSFATGLDAEGRSEPQEYVNTYAGGLFSTAGDMARLAMMFLNSGRLGDRRILSTEAIAEMGRDQTLHLPFNPITGHPVHFGLGWDGVRQGGLDAVEVTAWYKAGDADHYHSFFVVAPDERLAVAVLLTNGVGIGSVAGLLAERILLNALAERGTIAKVPSPWKAIAPPAVPASAEELAAVSGIYASSYCPCRLAPQPDGTLTLSHFVSGQWHHSTEGLRLRQNGRLVADDHPETAYRLVVAAGRRYLAARRPWGLGHYDMELPDSHDLPPQTLSARWQARVGRRWLMVDDPYCAFLALRHQSPVFSLVQVEGLDGYVAASLASAGFDLVQVVDPGQSDDRARMCLKIPIDNGWGLNDLVIEVRGGEEWIRWGSIRYRPLATVPALERGRGTVAVGHEGLGEWRRLPAASAITIDGAGAWYLYGADFALLGWGLNKGAVGKVDAGSYLLLHGTPGTTITLAVKN